jgi:hypothetical protein
VTYPSNLGIEALGKISERCFFYANGKPPDNDSLDEGHNAERKS